MRYVVEDETGEVLVVVDEDLIRQGSLFGTTWLAGDQWVLLGNPSGRKDPTLLGTLIPINQAKAFLALGERIRKERERSRARYPQVGSPSRPKGT